MNHTQHAVARGLKAGILPGKVLKSAYLRLNLETVLTENYEAAKMMVGG